MSRLGHISFYGWRISRRPFAGYVVLIALLVCVFSNERAFGYPAVNIAILGALLLCAALPLVSTLRFRDMGRSILWPLVPLPGLLYIAYVFILGGASASGAPRGGADPLPASILDRMFEGATLGSVVLFGLTTLLGMLVPSETEVVQ